MCVCFPIGFYFLTDSFLFFPAERSNRIQRMSFFVFQYLFCVLSPLPVLFCPMHRTAFAHCSLPTISLQRSGPCPQRRWLSAISVANCTVSRPCSFAFWACGLERLIPQNSPPPMRFLSPTGEASAQIGWLVMLEGQVRAHLGSFLLLPGGGYR